MTTETLTKLVASGVITVSETGVVRLTPSAWKTMTTPTASIKVVGG